MPTLEVVPCLLASSRTCCLLSPRLCSYAYASSRSFAVDSFLRPPVFPPRPCLYTAAYDSIFVFHKVVGHSMPPSSFAVAAKFILRARLAIVPAVALTSAPPSFESQTRRLGPLYVSRASRSAFYSTCLLSRSPTSSTRSSDFAPRRASSVDDAHSCIREAASAVYPPPPLRHHCSTVVRYHRIAVIDPNDDGPQAGRGLERWASGVGVGDQRARERDLSKWEVARVALRLHTRHALRVPHHRGDRSEADDGPGRGRKPLEHWASGERARIGRPERRRADPDPDQRRPLVEIKVNGRSCQWRYPRGTSESRTRRA
ncbi:hypothetical protein B0H13DRAFT_2368252 [Mycena leptocephala]|nr:hypothetical protein B0H13DRAFT_2368252 [Mycena leptocephala]